MTLLDVRIGDLTTATADAIATSADVDLGVGGGVNGAIHAAAGPELAAHVAAIGGCPVGEVRFTPAGQLDARWVIHGVGPRWEDGNHGEATLLSHLYGHIVEAAGEHSCRTLALPSYGTGAFGFPLDQAATTAVSALEKTLIGDWGSPTTQIRLIRWWVSSPDTEAAYRRAIEAASPRLRAVRWEDRPFRDSEEEPTSATRPLPFERIIDADDLAMLHAGLPALDMNEKWWAFWDGQRIRMFRSWTGYEIFSLRARPRPDGRPGAVLDQLAVCDDRSRYEASDDDALEALDGVLSMVLEA
jgi:O-acetyl-ADP-ribose deacetylase (regulator of RNase III)